MFRITVLWFVMFDIIIYKYYLFLNIVNNKLGLVLIFWVVCYGIINGFVLIIFEGLVLDGL